MRKWRQDSSEDYFKLLYKLQHGGPLLLIPEVNLVVNIIGQAVKDAMGLYGADAEIVPEVRVDRWWQGRTQQDVAKEWFRTKKHWPYCDLIEIEPTWINALLKKAGVEL